MIIFYYKNEGAISIFSDYESIPDYNIKKILEFDKTKKLSFFLSSHKKIEYDIKYKGNKIVFEEECTGNSVLEIYKKDSREEKIQKLLEFFMNIIPSDLRTPNYIILLTEKFEKILE